MIDRDPPRLLEDPSVPADLRSALSHAARHAPPLDTAAGLAKLEAAMQAPAAAGAGGGTIALAVVAAVTIGGAVWMVTRPGEEPPAPALADAAPSPLAPAAAVEIAGPEPDPGLEPAAAPDADALPEREAAPDPRPTIEAEARSAPARRRVEPRDDDALARDMAQLAAARRALGSDPARALALVETGRREFPESIFGEEREALRVLALAGLERDAEARRLGAAFLAAHPSSPFAERVRRAIEPSP